MVSILPPTGPAPKRFTTLGVALLVIGGLLLALGAVVVRSLVQEDRAAAARRVEGQQQLAARQVLIDSMQQCYGETIAAHGKWPEGWPGMGPNSALKVLNGQLDWVGINGALAQLDSCVRSRVPDSSCTFAHQTVAEFGMSDPLLAGGCSRPSTGNDVGWSYARLAR